MARLPLVIGGMLPIKRSWRSDLSQLASVLHVEPAFLTNAHALMVGEHQFHFRKMFTTRAMVKQVAMARGELIRLVTFLDRKLKLPDLRIPEVRKGIQKNKTEHRK